MKKLPGGVVAFYPSVMTRILLIVSVVFFGLFLPLFGSEDGEWHPQYIIVIVLTVFLWLWGFKNLFFPLPVCLLYPEKVSAGKRELFWDQLEKCYVRQEWRGSGKGRHLVHELVFLPAAQANAELLVINYFSLSKKDQKILKQEISLRGVPFEN